MGDDKSAMRNDSTRPVRPRRHGHAGSALLMALAVLVMAAAARADELPGDIRSWSSLPYRAYDVAVLSTGAPWFTAGDAVFTVDPATGVVTGYTLSAPDPVPAFNTLAVDAANHLWIADGSDRLVLFDPATGMFTPFPLPGGQFTLPAYPYGVTIAPDGTIWFTCWTDRSLGRYDPVGNTFQRFAPVGNLPNDPVEIAFDAAGIGYFTMRKAGGNPPGLGRIDPGTGAFQLWLNPYTGAFNPWGIVRVGSVFWFMDHSASKIVRFDPATEVFTPTSTAPELIDGHFLVADELGRLWFSAFGSQRLGRFDPTIATFAWKDIAELRPFPIGIARTTDGVVWLADTDGSGTFTGATRYTDPGPTPVPALGQWGLGVLAGVILLVGAAGVWRARRGRAVA